MKSIQHPYTDYSLEDAMKLARNLDLENSAREIDPKQARERIRAAFERVTHVWITGMAALDVLDAAIDGVDLRTKSRLI